METDYTYNEYEILSTKVTLERLKMMRSSKYYENFLTDPTINIQTPSNIENELKAIVKNQKKQKKRNKKLKKKQKSIPLFKKDAFIKI